MDSAFDKIRGCLMNNNTWTQWITIIHSNNNIIDLSETCGEKPSLQRMLLINRFSSGYIHKVVVIYFHNISKGFRARGNSALYLAVN